MSDPLPMPPVCLSISASDPSGVSWAAADMKTFTALGTFGACVLTGMVARSFLAIRGVHPVPDGFLREQLDAAMHSLPVIAVKVGNCLSVGSIRVIGRWLREHPNLPVLIDPVITEQLGVPTVQPEVITAIRNELLPRASLATPNRYEAAQLAGMDEVLTREDMEQAAQTIFKTCGCPTVVTGGGMGDESLDVLAGLDGLSHFTAPIVDRPGKVVGVGCTFAAAIVAQLARGEGMRESIWAAKSYVAALIEAAPPVPSDGVSPLCHVHPVDSLAQGDGIGVSTRAYQRRDESGSFPRQG